MADSLLSVCNLTTSWYNFAYSLSWSNQCQVAQVLSDIPFISVGILVFGVSVLFLVLKRVPPSTVSLFFSALLAFVAAALDLGLTAVSTITSEHTIRAREVLFALSIGFRFLFYWSYVAEPSRKDLSATGTEEVQKIRFLILECTSEPHNASWVHWGMPGKLAGKGLLVTIVIITTLQITWRVDPQFHQYNNVYATDVVLELLLSFMFLLKLLLNTVAFNSVDGLSMRIFGEYLPPISGLLLNIAIGVGDLLCFAFTESTVGRLLQAFEVYIVVVFVMVVAFFRQRDLLLSPASSQDEKRKNSAFTLPEPIRGSTFRITPPLIETPRMSTIIGIATQNKGSSREILRRSAHRSLNHVSSWLPFRIPRRRSRHEDEEVNLWNSEKVKVNPPYTGDLDTGLRVSLEASTQASEYKSWPELVCEASANHMSVTSALDTQSAITRSEKDSIHRGRIIHASRMDVLRRTIPFQIQAHSTPLSSVVSVTSEAKRTETVVTPPKTSPVYGLGGIQSPENAYDSQTSLTELSRQQGKETHWLFSTETFTKNLSYHNSDLNPELTRSPSIGQRTICSEVSLSNFPVPPNLTTPVPSLPASTPSYIKRIRGDRRVRLAAALPTSAQHADVLVPPETLPVTSLANAPSSPRFNSVPHTPTGEENESLSAEALKSSFHPDSEGTGYNVTSFIDDLATPRKPRRRTQEMASWPTESGSCLSTIQTSSNEKPLPPRVQFASQQLEGLPSSPATTKLSLLARSSELSQRGVVDEPIIIETKGQTRVTRPAHATMYSENKAAEGADRVQRTFVRRRPPPLVIQSYTERNPGTWRVQVLADD